MVMKVAKQRAETAAQVESCLRYRVALRSELLRILTELSDKLRQWHEKLCKKYSEAIRQLKIGKKKMEENLRAAEQKLRLIEEKKASTQSSLATLLKPYAGAAGASNLDPYGDLPKRDELVVKIYALVAALEEPMVSPIIFDAVQRLISRSPHEKMERVVENLTPTKEGQQCVLDFAGVQQLLQYTSAARANEDLAPFLAATSKYTPLLLRGPDQVRLAEILKEYREALVDRNSHASAKLLFVAEPFLKLLSKLKEEQQDDSVAAEVGLVLAMANFGAVTRVQRGCQLMAAILNLRSLQLRKHALNRILSEPFPGPTSEDMSAQVRTIDATYRSIEGGVGVLRNQAQSLAKDAANLMKVYGKQIDGLIQVIKRLAPRAHQGHGSGRPMSQDADFGCVDSSPRRKQESIAHLPALLAYQKGSESPTDIMTILQYQKILLKLQLRMRKWLRSTCSPNLPQDELSQTEDALQVMQKFISKRHPDYQESVHESAPSESSAADSPCPESPKRRSASVDVGKVWNVGNVGWEREISQTSRPSEGHTEKTEGEDDADGTASVGPPKWRRWSDILHDRPNQAQVSQLSSAFQEHLQQSRKLVDDSSSSSEQAEVSEVREDSPRMKEMRSKATFLNWVSGRPASSRTQKKGRMKGLALTAKRHSTKPRQKPQAKPKLEPEDPSRVYMDLMGRHVLQPEEPEASEVQSEASEASEYSESDDGDQMHSPVAQRILLEAVEIPRVVPQRVQKHARTRTNSEEVTLVVGEGHTPKPGRLALSPTGELMRGKGRLFSPTVQAETSKFRLEGVRVSQCEAKRKASADTEDDVSATSSEEVPEEVTEPQDTGFSRMRTPTLVKDGFLLVDDAAADEEDEDEGEVDEIDRDDIEADEAAKKPQTDRNHLHLRQPSRDASPGSKSSQSARSPSRKSRSSMARQEDDSPEARSLAETTRWLQDVLESERHSSAKPLLPRTGRAFPSSSDEYTCAGPPGTARRLRLHQRPTSQPAKPVQEELEEEPVAEEVQSWRCLPKEPGGDWKLLAGSPQGDQEMQAAPVPRMATTATTSTEEEAEANQMQVVRISSMEFPLPRPGAAAMNIMNQRGKRCLGRARVVVSHSNCELQPSPSSSNASDVETLEDEMGSDAPQFAASTPDRQITPEAAETSNAVAGTQPEAAERPQDRELLKHMGPLRKHLPMTRRGVVPLLTPHEVDEVELEQLELLGEAVRDRRNPRHRHLVSGFSGLSTSKPSNPSPGDDVPGGARETAVGATLQQHEGVTLPMATAVKADLDMDCPTGFRTRECVPAAEDDGAEGPGLVSDPSAPSIPQSRVTLPPRHGVTMEGDAMEELVAALQHLFHDPDDVGSFRPGSQPAVSLRVIAHQAVAAAAEEESPSISEPSPSKPSGPSQRASEWSNVESEVVEKAGFPPVSTETPRRSKEAAKGSYHSHKTRAATSALRDREGVRQRPALSELVASDRPIAPAPSSAVEDQLKSWRTRPVSAGVGIRGKQTRPPFGSNTPRN